MIKPTGNQRIWQVKKLVRNQNKLLWHDRTDFRYKMLPGNRPGCNLTRECCRQARGCDLGSAPIPSHCRWSMLLSLLTARLPWQQAWGMSFTSTDHAAIHHNVVSSWLHRNTKLVFCSTAVAAMQLPRERNRITQSEAAGGDRKAEDAFKAEELHAPCLQCSFTR